MDDRRVLKVSEFYHSACPTKSLFFSKVHDENRYTVLYDAVRLMCSSLKDGDSDILSKIRELLTDKYLDEWFGFEWQKPLQVEDDATCFGRFLNWLKDFKVLGANEKVAVDVGKGLSLSGRVDLIVEKKGHVYALIIFPKKADKSPGGKSTHTSTKTDLYALTAKAALEETYPGIKVSLVYLFNDTDESGNISAFLEVKTRKSNVFTLDFKEFYEDGAFDRDGIEGTIGKVLADKPAADCYNCSMRDLCSLDTVKNMNRLPSKELERESVPYVMPGFTEEQEKVVRHKEGPMLVCAPPGSGKTATLVGRIKALIGADVPPEFILAITFTRDAAGELKKRCQSFCEADSMPEISTIHSLAMEILTKNPGLLGRKVKVLSTFERFELIERLLKESERITGLNYSVVKGKNGLYATVSRYLDEYFKDKAAFFEKRRVGESFNSFAESFNAAVKSHGFVTFDDLVPMAISLMKEHPEVLCGLTARYKYIMVDEYQDVDEGQVEFIYMLSSHENLVVVGDDDQSIYAFRGGSNKYMLEFGERFPNMVRIVFTKNFRSTDELVRSSETFIRRNKARIAKEVKGTRRKGTAPIIKTGKEPKDVDNVIKVLLDRGYKHSEIAVLATKNATLEDLAREVKTQTVLGKSYLADSALFRIILDILTLFFKGKSDSVLYHVLTVMGVDPDYSQYPDIFDGDFSGKRTEPTYKALKFIHQCLNVLRQGATSAYFSDFIFHAYGMDNSAVEASFNDMLTSYHVKDTSALYDAMKYMADYGDETRIEPDTSNAVLFITSHESKGMEWRAVILIDDFKKDDVSEETNRLYYVAMTRAKDVLYILTEDGKTLLAPA